MTSTEQERWVDVASERYKSRERGRHSESEASFGQGSSIVQCHAVEILLHFT